MSIEYVLQASGATRALAAARGVVTRDLQAQGRLDQLEREFREVRNFATTMKDAGLVGLVTIAAAEGRLLTMSEIDGETMKRDVPATTGIAAKHMLLAQKRVAVHLGSD